MNSSNLWDEKLEVKCASFYQVQSFLSNFSAEIIILVNLESSPLYEKLFEECD